MSRDALLAREAAGTEKNDFNERFPPEDVAKDALLAFSVFERKKERYLWLVSILNKNQHSTESNCPRTKSKWLSLTEASAFLPGCKHIPLSWWLRLYRKTVCLSQPMNGNECAWRDVNEHKSPTNNNTQTESATKGKILWLKTQRTNSKEYVKQTHSHHQTFARVVLSKKR